MLPEASVLVSDIIFLFSSFFVTFRSNGLLRTGVAFLSCYFIGVNSSSTGFIIRCFLRGVLAR